MWFKNLICKIFGHDFRYPYTGGMPPFKAMCARCHKKWVADYSGDILANPEDVWSEVSEFKGEKRTDEQLIKDWIR